MGKRQGAGAGEGKAADGGTSANLGFEAKLWLGADKRRNNMDAAEYTCTVSSHCAALTPRRSSTGK